MDLSEAESFLATRVSAKQKAARPDLLSGCFAEQRAVILDTAKLKYEFCTRRAAKTFTWGVEAVNDSYDWPHAKYLFLGITREESKRIFWKDVLKALNEKYAVGMAFNESALVATMPNGAEIYLGAADANEQEMRKLLGQKYRKVLIDEAQDWTHTNLEDLIYTVLKPAMVDYQGSITVAGTPGALLNSFFRRLTPSSVQAGVKGEKGSCPGWSGHCWDTSANTSIMPDGQTMSQHWVTEIAELTASHPGIENTPAFRRQYRGEWVLAEDLLVYRYQPGRNDYDILPKVDGYGQWHFILGIDLGYEDETAFVPMGYHDDLPKLFILEVEKERKLDITAVALRAKRHMAKRSFETIVIDGSNKQAVMELANRHQLPLTPADKTGKSDFIELMNADYIMGNILLSPECRGLKEEYGSLIWDDRKLRRVEHPACPNHACDGALYAWRFCYQYLHKEKEKEPVFGTPAWGQKEAKLLMEQTRKDLLRDKAKKRELDEYGFVMEDDPLKLPTLDGEEFF